MPMKMLPMTQRELLKYFADYRSAFPDWEVRHKVVLVRSLPPIEQHIAFYGLESGAYRPSCSITVVGPSSGFQLLYMFLDVRHRQVYPREHERRLPSIIRAMEEQFLPSIRKPLDANEVLRLAEERAQLINITNLKYLGGLAVLAAFLGDDKRSLRWCARVDEEGRRPDMADQVVEGGWQKATIDFIAQLSAALTGGKRDAFLKSCSDQYLRQS